MSRLFESTLTGKISRMLVEGEDIKPIEKTKDELIRDYGTDDVDLINAGKEPEKRVVLKGSDSKLEESLYDEIADFMADLDPYGYNDAYDGDDAEKHSKAVSDISNDKDKVIKYLEGIVDYEESTPDMISRAKELLRELKQTNESDDITSEDLEKDEELSKAKSKEAIEDRIGELRQAIKDGVSEDEKTEMEKEIASLELELDECDKTLKEESYEEPIFIKIENALADAGLSVDRYSDMGMLTKNLGWVVSDSDGEVNLTCAGTYLSESVEVATNDGSTVSTQDAASVSSNDGQVTVQTADTVVVISNSAMPTEDVPVAEPTEVPSEEVTEPVEDTPVAEPVEEVPEDTENGDNGSDDLDEADEYSIDANVDAKSLDVVKNQGVTYMLHIVETSGKETYWVCDNFNAETNEGDNAKFFDTKEEADKEYFDRVGLEPVGE